jgi:hypothetical protein
MDWKSNIFDKSIALFLILIFITQVSAGVS